MKGEEKLWAILNEKLDNLRATNRLPQAIRSPKRRLKLPGAHSKEIRRHSPRALRNWANCSNKREITLEPRHIC